MDELRQEPLVLFQKDFFQYEIVMHRFQEAGITPRIIHATGQLSTVHRLVRSGVASGFLLKNTLEELPEPGGDLPGPTHSGPDQSGLGAGAAPVQ